MKKLVPGSSRRVLVVAFAALAAWLGGCAPLTNADDAWTAGGGGGGGAGARAGFSAETHEVTPRAARDDRSPRETVRVESVDMRPPRMGIVLCRQCQ